MIDLHIHSILSDGVLTPKEILDKAKENGVKYLSIADHDSIGAYTKDFFEHAKKLGINIIVGVEMSTKINGVGVHMLGYDFNIHNADLLTILDKLKNARKDYLIKVCAKLEDLGYKVNLGELLNVSTVTKSHIALDVIHNEQNVDMFISAFGHTPSKGEFIETLLNEGCPAHVERFNITPREASEIIRNAGGKVILAHPVCYKYEDNLNFSQVLEIANNAKVDGIEANYLYVDKYNNLIDEIDLWNNVAKDNNWITTMGSDYHMSDGIRPEIGFGNYYERMKSINLDKIVKHIINEK